jgi:hypothetical protein
MAFHHVTWFFKIAFGFVALYFMWRVFPSFSLSCFSLTSLVMFQVKLTSLNLPPLDQKFQTWSSQNFQNPSPSLLFLYFIIKLFQQLISVIKCCFGLVTNKVTILENYFGSSLFWFNSKQN